MATIYDSLIANVFLPHFQEFGQEGLPILVNSKVSSQAFLSVYKSLDPIEQLPETDKKKLKKTVIEMFPIKTEAELMDAAKIVYTIGVVSQYVQTPPETA